MAYLRRRPDGRVEIRESLSTRAGPRARTLAVFRGGLAPDVLERAAARARRPFDRQALVARADALGIPSSSRRGDASARALLSDLRDGVSLDPRIAGLLRSAFERIPVAPIPEALTEVAEWIGIGARRRGRALRGLLRASDRLVRARPPRRAEKRWRFPRFASRHVPAGSRA